MAMNVPSASIADSDRHLQLLRGLEERSDLRYRKIRQCPDVHVAGSAAHDGEPRTDIEERQGRFAAPDDFRGKRAPGDVAKYAAHWVRKRLVKSSSRFYQNIVEETPQAFSGLKTPCDTATRAPPRCGQSGYRLNMSAYHPGGPSRAAWASARNVSMPMGSGFFLSKLLPPYMRNILPRGRDGP